MKLTFLQSGIDSLKKGYENLVLYEEEYFIGCKNSKARFFHLKDSILFIQHGVEILLKQILARESEYLLFSNLDESVKKAYKEVKQKKLNSVFESSLKNKIHTVSFSEAIERVKIISNISMDSRLEEKLHQLETYRNIIMHSEPHLDEVELNNTLEGLIDLLDSFFYKSIGVKYDTVSGYSQLIKNYNLFAELLHKKNLDFKAKVTEIFLAALKEADISIGLNEIKLKGLQT